MARTVTLTVPSWQTDSLITEIQQLQGLIGLRVQDGISLQPPGDVITLEITNHHLPALFHLLDQAGMGQDASTSISTTQPLSLVSKSASKAISLDNSESTWEEISNLIAQESNMTINGLLVMAIAGILATIGLATNALHLVIGAMMIAPGFEPIIRISLGVITKSRAWKRGLSQTLQGYGVLILAAAVTTWVLQGLGQNPLGREASYLPSGVLVSYWSSITAPSMFVTIVAGIAGALVIAINRSVLTSGVMVALALVPTATLFGEAIALGNLTLAVQGLRRWVLEVGIILITSALVFGWKQSQVHRRKSMM